MLAECWTDYVIMVLGYTAAFSLATYFIPLLYSWWFLWPQDLKKKYGAEWAMVTGGSSGIGRAVAEKLAKQGLNVIIVAVPDKLLDTAIEELKRDYPDLQFRSVGVDLSRDGYMEAITTATADVHVQICFCNAGFVRTGLFVGTPVGVPLANFNVNATSSMVIAHHFLSKLRDSGDRGCCVFTSSPAAHIPTPITCMYGPTKAFLTSLAMSLAPEFRSYGIDVMVLNPSPVATRFYEGNKHGIGALDFAAKLATSPETIANAMFGAVGRVVVRDQGIQSVLYHFIPRLIDISALAELFARFAHTSSEFKTVAAAMPAPSGKRPGGATTGTAGAAAGKAGEGATGAGARQRRGR